VSLPVLFAAGGAAWESSLLAALDGSVESEELTVVRRCVDVVELLSVAATGQAVAVVVDVHLRRFDADAVDRLIALGVVVIGVTGTDTEAEHDQLRAIGVEFAVTADVSVAVLASVVAEAVAGHGRVDERVDRTFADPAFTSGRLSVPATAEGSQRTGARSSSVAVRGVVIAVWGPGGAPGRTTVAINLADELSRLGNETLLIDADVYGGVIAPALGLLDESPGLAAACRHAHAQQLDEVRLAELCWQLHEGLKVLTGLSRPNRWPELRPSALGRVLDAARSLADCTVVDVGFCLEDDEELSYDTMAPRRNGATLAILDAVDTVLAVGAADPIGIQRLIRGLEELREAEISASVSVVMNRIRKGPVPGDATAETTQALQRFAGRSPAAFLPADATSLDLAMACGQTLAEAAPHSPLRRAIAELAATMSGADGAEVPPSGRWRRQLARAGRRAGKQGKRRAP
jgi:Flp pilus assembly CpaE family ATPase